jgi:hypothetical protein
MTDVCPACDRKVLTGFYFRVSRVRARFCSFECATSPRGRQHVNSKNGKEETDARKQGTRTTS